MSDNVKFSKIIGLILNQYMHAIDRARNSSCSAEWLYESGRKDAIFELLNKVERIGSDEQPK